MPCAQWLKTKVSPEIDCHLKGSIDRGDFQVTANGGVLTVSVPLHASVTARGRGEIGKNIQQTAEGSLEARARVTADIGEDWQPTVKVDPDFTWRDRAHVDVLGIKITFASKVEPEIRKAMEQLKSVVDGEVKKLKVRESVDAMWKSGFGVARISADPDVWFRFSPRAIGFSGISSTSDTLEVRVMATGLTQTFVGPQPAPAAPSPLPLLQKNIPHGQFNLYLPVFADYSAAGQSLERLLRVNEKQIFAVPSVGNVAVTFRKVDIYPAKGGAIAVGITLEADPPNRFFDTKGTIWLKANVAVENEGKKLIPKSLDYGAETNNSATNILLAIARLPPVKEKIEKALTYDFSKDYERGLTAANAAMNRSVGKDLTLEGAISEAGIDEIKATANGVYMGIEVSGNLRLRSLASTK